MSSEVTMFCEGENCPFKRDCRCYRKKDGSAVDDVAYFIDTPYDIDRHECLFFWKKP